MTGLSNVKALALDSLSIVLALDGSRLPSTITYFCKTKDINASPDQLWQQPRYQQHIEPCQDAKFVLGQSGYL